MSLDVYLNLRGSVLIPKGSGIFVREGGSTEQITREEWDRRYPDREPVIAPPSDEPSDEVFSANITHNLNRMAVEAEIYQHCWRPDEIGITHAKQLIEPLAAGLASLEKEPDLFKKFNPANGWGDYHGFLAFVRAYLRACRDYPAAEVRVSR